MIIYLSIYPLTYLLLHPSCAGAYLLSHEVLPASGSPLPEARHRPCMAFTNDTDLAATYGGAEVLVLFGGTKDPGGTDRGEKSV